MYVTDLPRSECVSRLNAVVAREGPGPNEKSDARALGLVEEYDFKIVLRGGMAGEQGLVPILFGRFESHPTYTVVHSFQSVPKMVGLGVYAYIVICLVLMLAGPVSRFLSGNSLTNDFTMDLVILCFTFTSSIIVSGWMWIINKDWDLPRFDFLVQTLDARRLDQ